MPWDDETYLGTKVSASAPQHPPRPLPLERFQTYSLHAAPRVLPHGTVRFKGICPRVPRAYETIVVPRGTGKYT
jgi:hypothetical protein